MTDTARLRTVIVEQVCRWYGCRPDEITDDRPLAELGLTSRDAVALTALIGEKTNRRLPPTLLWDTPTIGTLLERMTHGEGDDAPADPAQIAPPPGNEPAAGGTAGDEPVAVIGVGCRFPGGADSPDAYWRLLTEGRDAVGTVPEGRWASFTGDGGALPPEISRHGAFLDGPDPGGGPAANAGPATGTDGIAGFDAEFFGIGSAEATAMDPQQRILLEVAREALDHAALSAASLAGTRTGVFLGISGNEYAHLTTADPASVDAWTVPGSALGVAAGRLSYLLDLRGPSLSVDTACSSSLVAVHHAVRSLTRGESDTALAAGVNLLLSPHVTLGLQRAGALAPDGRCKAFDAGANGIVRGEGCGVVVLKRLPDAERDGDRVLAVIRSTGVNSDGRSNGLTAPSARAQRALLAGAHTEPATVDYVEAHGTGTALGDPIEAGALGHVLGAGSGRPADQPLLIGSAKTNLGHLEAAAGIAGLIKTVLALHHGEIPGQLHFSEPGPHADPEALGLRVVTGPEPWPRYSGTATAGVSAFGFGGTNAHVVLAEHRPRRRPAIRAAQAARAAQAVREAQDAQAVREAQAVPGAQGAHGERPVVLLLDGPSEDRVRAHAGELAAWLAAPGSRAVRPADVARTLAGRTGRGRHRAAVVARGREDVVGALTRYASGDPDPRLHTGSGAPPGGRGPVWVFSGYGSQWPGMARGLLSTEPVFAAAVDRMAALLAEHAGLDLHALLRPEADLTTPDVAMPVLYAVQVALAELWRAYGVEPAAVIGHSLGEVAAAVVAGALDEATGARITAVRSRLLAGLTGGAMAVVDRPGDALGVPAGELPSLRVAVHASPVQSVVTGSAEDVDGLIARVTEAGGFARPLPVTVAGHSSAVDPLLGPLAEELGTVPHAGARLRRYTTVLDDPRSDAPCDAEYWVANLRRPVRFAQAVRAAAEDGHRVFVEVSPHPTQLHPLTETLREALGGAGAGPGAGPDAGPDARPDARPGAGPDARPGAAPGAGPGAGAADVLVLPTLSRDTDDALAFRSSLARLLVRGVPVTAPRETLNPEGRIVDVPSPRWRHVRFWAGEAPGRAPLAADRAPLPRGVSAVDRLRRCVADVMGYSEDRVDPDAPLTDLGLDSLSAVRVRAAVEREFGTVLEAAALLRQGTLREVSGLLPRLGDGTPDRSAGPAGARATAGVPGRLRTFPAVHAVPAGPAGSGTGAPLFLAHAAGGSADVYGRLAERLAGSHPVLGFDRLSEPEEVTERAAEFAARIRETRPEGPWLLGGWSYGGLLAQEAARLLSADGTVAALVLLDSVLPLPAPVGETPAAEARRRFEGFAAFVERTYGRPLALPYGELALLDDTGQVDLVLKTLEQTVELPAAVLAHQRASYLDLRSAERHTPGPYPGRTLLYRATEPAPHTVRDARYERDDEALGWDAFCSDLTVAPLPGHHLSLLDPPVVDTLAELLVRDLPPV